MTGEKELVTDKSLKSLIFLRSSTFIPKIKVIRLKAQKKKNTELFCDV